MVDKLIHKPVENTIMEEKVMLDELLIEELKEIKIDDANLKELETRLAGVGVGCGGGACAGSCGKIM